MPFTNLLSFTLEETIFTYYDKVSLRRVYCQPSSRIEKDQITEILWKDQMFFFKLEWGVSKRWHHYLLVKTSDQWLPERTAEKTW